MELATLQAAYVVGGFFLIPVKTISTSNEKCLSDCLSYISAHGLMCLPIVNANCSKTLIFK